MDWFRRIRRPQAIRIETSLASDIGTQNSRDMSLKGDDFSL
jgi:hypothetical protein